MTEAARAIAVACSFVVAASAYCTQTPEIIPVIGLLRPGSFTSNDRSLEGLRLALAEAGYIEGHNIKIEQRFAQGQASRLPQLAAELVRIKADVIIATNEASVLAAKQATSTTPIVMVAYDHDPLASGLIQSLSRPGGNITGVFARQVELPGKRLELLKQTLPGLSRVAVFYDAANPQPLAELGPAARVLALQLHPVGVRSNDDFDAAFGKAKQQGAGAAVVLFSPMLYVHRGRLATAALEARLPTMTQERDFVLAGALMSYAPDRDAILARVAYYVDRLLKGANPRDLPVEQADKFKLAVNLKIAKALGIKIPDSILLRADEVIR